MAEHQPRRRLDQPRAGGRAVALQRLSVDSEWFAQFAERLARFLGTGTYLLWQTVFVIVWIGLNLTGLVYQWDKYPFILLNLAFSTQAAYAAPLILLAQNRQDDRDRISLEEDRSRSSRTSADTEYLARELAALRLSVGELVTRDYLRGEMERGALSPGGGSGLDRATRKALDKAVEKAVERTVEKAVDKAVERAVTRAVADALDRAPAGGDDGHGRSGTAPTNGDGPRT